MKKIEAIIRTSKFEEVKEALSQMRIRFLSYSEVKGIGLEKAQGQVYRGTAYDADYIQRTKIEIIVAEEQVESTMDCIMKAAYTGEIGDGKVFVIPIENLHRIRNKAEGAAAL
ncbi:P-II family nitrogen regulator [Xanthovirga aplysinae]|uniref:P-II family nitrogen regulator n=1 Tax=Xanthovirga aplysinae TaxID=2529853 RepID=UPI0012BC4989|nr:P-II family nitrogen regulator [Xanthovirga aplysinae]MTI32255.1 P-II family nitrogen regulator [Xanthovirga aplysinae]